MKKIIPIILLLIATAPLIPYHTPTTKIVVKKAETNAPAHVQEKRALFRSHYLYKWIPRHRSQIRFYDLGHRITWALFGNDDDGLFGEEPSANFWPGCAPSAMQAASWCLRNPLHNFTFYVIGTADRGQTNEFTLIQLAENDCKTLTYQEKARTVFAGQSSSFYLGLHNWLPFLSCRLDYKRRFEFYLGWRERGNFGLKLILGRQIPETTTSLCATDPVREPAV